MATKKNNSKKTTEKSTLIKIAETIGTVAGEIAVKKNQLVHIASDAIDSVKSKIQDIKGKKKTTPAKAVKAVVKKAAKKTTVVKKAAVKKAAAKVVKKAVKPVAKKAAKKVATAKKTVKKAAKKVRGKR